MALPDLILQIVSFVVALAFVFYVVQTILVLWSLVGKASEFLFIDILVWSQNADEAMERVTKSYEWRIERWTTLSNTVLTSMLAFVSAVALEFFKDTIKSDHRTTLLTLAISVGAALIVYSICHRTITRLRSEFLQLYTLLLLLG